MALPDLSWPVEDAFPGTLCDVTSHDLLGAGALDEAPVGFTLLDESTHPFESSVSSCPSLAPIDDIEDEVWTWTDLPQVVTPSLLTWEAFHDPTSEEPCPASLSEAGTNTFDAIVQKESNENEGLQKSSVLVRTDACLSALSHLALGRDSVLYSYNKDTLTFNPLLKGLHMSGFSPNTIESLSNRFLESGKRFRFLQDWSDKAYQQRNANPTWISLAEAVTVVLSTLQATLGLELPSAATALQLQALFQRPEAVLACFERLVTAIDPLARDDEILSSLYDQVQQLEHTSDWLRDILLEVLARVSRPWLESVAVWIGLQHDPTSYSSQGGPNLAFVKTEYDASTQVATKDVGIPEYTYEPERMPAFMPKEEAQIIYHSGKSLQFLKTVHSDHPLARASASIARETPPLTWTFTWQDIEKIEAKSREYEKSVAAALQKYSQNKSIGEDVAIESFVPGISEQCDTFGRDSNDVSSHLRATMVSFDQTPPTYSDNNEDPLHCLLQGVCSPGRTAITGSDGSSIFAPPISLMPLLSFAPILSTQARLINASCIRLLFGQHHLRSHLRLLRRYQLFGDGVFSSRLSHALFDPELETAERRQGVARSGGMMGLQLGSRDNWPPASSELRLALMGILTETYNTSGGSESGHAQDYLAARNEDLPGGLSFAIREMSQEELDSCMDPHSIGALDFLRLRYKPPAALKSIISNESFSKYDRIFKLLLRMARMMFVVNQLFRDAIDRTSYWQGIEPVAQRFRIEAHHFVSTVCNYFMEVGIGATWQQFENKLDEIERLSSEGEAMALGQAEGMQRLCECHERVLDRILFALLLRKRQEQMMKLLQDIFAGILSFARYSRRRALGLQRRAGDAAEVRQMYGSFRKRVGVFIQVCRGLSEQRGYGSRHRLGLAGPDEGLFSQGDLSEEGASSIGQLLVRLEMTGYYSQRVEGI
ncbi:MAG: hypothetical protein M1817_003308 [Caeruleum heppii]|nr:MAG: hypothetical protein M1817_003308 [Caeruleum heppii]